ncbi:MAG TPA: isochorismatase family protein [Desulfuromonadaceae bacterium]
MEKNAALLIVDVQNDFCPGGALQILDGDRVVEPINRALEYFSAAGLPILASRDWHPPKTRHFRDFGGAWPIHCVQGTAGAAFHPGLRLPEEAVILSKGINPELDGYSAFEGITADGRMMADLLHELKVRKLYIGGLATDFCVLCTTLEALRNGIKVTVLTDAVAGVDMVPGESACALDDMEKSGAQLATVAELLAVSGQGKRC